MPALQIAKPEGGSAQDSLVLHDFVASESRLLADFEHLLARHRKTACCKSRQDDIATRLLVQALRKA